MTLNSTPNTQTLTTTSYLRKHNNKNDSTRVQTNNKTTFTMTNLLVRVVLYLWVLLALVPTGAVSSSSSKSSKVSSFSSKSKTSLPHKRKKTAKVHSVVLSKRSSKLKSSTTSKSRKSASVPKKGSKHTVACSDGFHKASSKGGDLEAFAFDACELFRGDSGTYHRNLCWTEISPYE